MSAEACEAPTEQQPINFGKRLAHTDKLVRDRGFRTLKKWVAKHPDLERLDFMKLWKGLYFGIWMADKRPVQQELAVNIAMLLQEVPRTKQVMWMDCFWETMQTAWEQLDIHRISKYLQVIRIVIAEAFKAMRVAGWPLEEMRSLGNVFTRATPLGGPNAPSLGLLLQFTRVMWEELRPQLEAGSTPRKVLLAFLEPFCALAEGSSKDSLVRHIHQHIFRRAPHELLNSLVSSILAAAARPDVPKMNREALYDTADALERTAKTSLPKGVKPLSLLEDPDSQVSSLLTSLPPLELPRSHEPLAGQQASKAKMKKGKKRKAQKANGEAGGGATFCMSPLQLPHSAMPLVESDKATGPVRKAKRANRRGNPTSCEGKATSAVRPTKKKRKRSTV